MIGRATIIAIEGAHGTGKTTLTYALSASLAAQGHPINVVGEVVRSSPWFQEALLRGDGTVEQHAFVHLFADQLRREIEATLHSTYVVLDRTVFSCLGYWDLRSRGNTSDGSAELLETFAAHYSASYDFVIYCHDRYPLERGQDPFRNTDESFRAESDQAIAAVLERNGVSCTSLPTGLTVSQKVSWAESLIFAHEQGS